MNESDFKKGTTFGVIGVCGANGNLIARILKERGFNVIGTDLSQKSECRFASALEDYDFDVFYGRTPDAFFNRSDYIIPPASLPKDSEMYKRINKPILELNDIIEIFQPEKEVFGITGTNGKTTSTTLLKRIASDNGIEPCEHKLEGMQGNAEFIPILQSRLDGDIGILEVGTFGVPGTVGRIAKNTNMSGGLITNITPDHLNDLGSFMDYANVKGEFIKELNHKKLIVNGHDPTIMGLLRELNYDGEVITFGVDETPDSIGIKECVCGNEITVKEIISGCGYYFCKCGITTPQVDYIATNVDLANRTFDLYTPEGEQIISPTKSEPCIIPRYYQDVLVAEVEEDEYVLLGYFNPRMVGAFSPARPNEYIIKALSDTSQGGLTVSPSNINITSSDGITFTRSDVGETEDIVYADSDNVYRKAEVYNKLQTDLLLKEIWDYIHEHCPDEETDDEDDLDG